MRLRSSHLVFLVLLLCSVQLREDFTLQFVEGAIAGRSGTSAQRHDTASAAQRHLVPHPAFHPRIQVVTTLDAAARTAHQAAWPVPQPARAAAEVTTRTSLRRA
jgi:hypothetical protein